MSESLNWRTIDEIAKIGQDVLRGRDVVLSSNTDSSETLPGSLMNLWIACQSQQGSEISDISSASMMPPIVWLNWQGWRKHDSGQFKLAQQDFYDAWNERRSCDGQHSRFQDFYLARIALGLGRTQLRSGHWENARGWFLYSLSVARRAGDESLLYKCYGSLGELFIRASATMQGFACLNLAYRLLPAGSAQRARQLNYIATALGRLREHVRAQSLLMTSYWMAKDQGDFRSLWHALARLEFSRLTAPVKITQAVNSLDKFAIKPELAPNIALGYWNLARARAGMVNNNHADEIILAHLKSAILAFNSVPAPMELAWAGLWMHQFTGNDESWLDALVGVRELMNIEALKPPKPVGILDMVFAHGSLPEGRAYEELLALPKKVTDLEKLDRFFFL